MERVLINTMPARDLLSLYEDSCDLGYEEMKELVVLEVKRRSGEDVSSAEWEGAMDLLRESGGTIHVCQTKGS